MSKFMHGNVEGTWPEKATDTTQPECNDRLSSDRTAKGIKLCAEWLRFCLSHGWKKHQLDALEKIWWEHHDGKGNLIR
jgi:hypothetical protein